MIRNDAHNASSIQLEQNVRPGELQASLRIVCDFGSYRTWQASRSKAAQICHHGRYSRITCSTPTAIVAAKGGPVKYLRLVGAYSPRSRLTSKPYHTQFLVAVPQGERKLGVGIEKVLRGPTGAALHRVLAVYSLVVGPVRKTHPLK